MSSSTEQFSIRESIRWREAAIHLGSYFAAFLLLLVPKRMLTSRLRKTLHGLYGDMPSNNIVLYKSGRSALKGLMMGLRGTNTFRSDAFVPDYICNVVGDACEAAGFSVHEYPLDGDFNPDWDRLEEALRVRQAPVLVLCSLFGSSPSESPELAKLHKSIPDLFVVADECQNLRFGPAILPSEHSAIVVSFNDKTCPGIMGGAIISATDSARQSLFEQTSLGDRLKCAMFLGVSAVKKLMRESFHILRVTFSQRRRYRLPLAYEYSECKAPHYALTAEPIYKISAARALLSLGRLTRYEQHRKENAEALASLCHEQSHPSRVQPPFIPLLVTALDVETSRFPAPVKAPYAQREEPTRRVRDVYALRVNVPYIRYSSKTGHQDVRD